MIMMEFKYFFLYSTFYYAPGEGVMLKIISKYT
jgi:hypothetical protein